MLNVCTIEFITGEAEDIGQSPILSQNLDFTFRAADWLMFSTHKYGLVIRAALNNTVND